MDINRAIKIINLEPTEFCALKKEKMEAFKVFFRSFGVDKKNKNGRINNGTIPWLKHVSFMNRQKVA